MILEYVCGDNVLLVMGSASPPAEGDEIVLFNDQTEVLECYVVTGQRRYLEVRPTGPQERTRWCATERPERVTVFLEPAE